MDRWACVDAAALPLQLLLKAQPAWASRPAAVVAGDTPQSLVQYVNRRAYTLGVRPGHRYAMALALAKDLQAGTISRTQIDRHVGELTDRLRRHSPHVEPSTDAPGVFWLDAQGLGRLHPSLHAWAQAVRLDLRRTGVSIAIAVGFTRFGAYALARCHQGITVCADADEERTLVQRVPLSSMDLDADVRERFATLGIDTVGDFLRLPADGIRQQFGQAAHALHQLAAGRRWVPLVPLPGEEPQERLIHFDAPESQIDRLIFIVKRLLGSLVPAVAARAHAVVALTLRMTLDDRTTRIERIRPATSTLDVVQLLALIRLRLDPSTFRPVDKLEVALSNAEGRHARGLSAGIVTLHVVATTCPASPDQRRLFPQHARRDPDLADEAIARLRAEFGERSVVRARIGDAHLPAAQFAWEPMERMPLRSSPQVVAVRPLVRRIYASPVPLPDFRLGESIGPYVVSGGWWGKPSQRDMRRDYYFAPDADGNLRWVYYDHRRRRFFLQGCVQ